MEELHIKLKETEPRHLKYENNISANDFKQIALVLFDLSNNGVPIEKAILEFKKLKSAEFPW